MESESGLDGEKLQEIRERHQDERGGIVKAHADRAALLAEVDRLRTDADDRERRHKAALVIMELEHKAEVQRLRALLDVPYRPGLPSVEQVQRHEARGGLWMWTTKADGLFSVQLRARAGVVEWAPGGAWIPMPPIDPAGRFRPCTTPDGTPCPWPEVPHGG